MLIAIVLAAVAVPSCKRATPAVGNRVPLAKNALENAVAGMQKTPVHTNLEKSELAAFTSAIAQLAGKTDGDLGEPLLIHAEVLRLLDSPNGYTLRVDWVDRNYEVTGIYLVDAEGSNIRYDNVVTWPSDKRQYPNGWLKMGFPIQFDQKSTDAWGDDPDAPPAIKRTLASLSGAKVGLITTMGMLKQTVGVVFDDGILAQGPKAGTKP
jgi:hypothetical protein